jgi:uncharacterized protein YtpQ (UPF0354 family)
MLNLECVMAGGLRLGLVLMAFAVGACAGEPRRVMSSEDFTALHADAIGHYASELEVRVTGPLQVSTEYNGDWITILLSEPYAHYRKDPGLLGSIIEEGITTFAQASGYLPGAIDATSVVPVIRAVEFLDEMGHAPGSRGELERPLVYDRYNDHLIVLYAEDLTNTFRYLHEDELKNSGIARAGVRALSIENLMARIPEPELHQDDQRFALSVGGGFEASLLLLDILWGDDVWQRRGTDLAGDPVIAVPTASRILVAGSDDPEGLSWLRWAARYRMAREANPISQRLFIYRDGSFQSFDG